MEPIQEYEYKEEIQRLQKENSQLKQEVRRLKERLNWAMGQLQFT